MLRKPRQCWWEGEEGGGLGEYPILTQCMANRHVWRTMGRSKSGALPPSPARPTRPRPTFQTKNLGCTYMPTNTKFNGWWKNAPIVSLKNKGRICKKREWNIVRVYDMCIKIWCFLCMKPRPPCIFFCVYVHWSSSPNDSFIHIYVSLYVYIFNVYCKHL